MSKNKTEQERVNEQLTKENPDLPSMSSIEEQRLDDIANQDNPVDDEPFENGFIQPWDN